MKYKFNLSRRISMGYIIISIVASMATLICIFTLQRSKDLDNRLRTEALPLYLNLKEFVAVSDESVKLINSWVFQPNTLQKEQLKDMHAKQYPKLKRNIQKFLIESNNTQFSDSIKTALSNMDKIIGYESEIMATLSVDSLYSNDVAVDKSIGLMEKSIVPMNASLDIFVTKLIKSQEATIDNAQNEKQNAYYFLTMMLIGMIAISLGVAWGANIYTRQNIVKPITQIKDIVVLLGQGKIEDITMKDRSDEIGEMIVAIKGLMDGTNDKSKFAKKIGEGNYDEQFNLLSEEDIIGRALLDMRDNLKKNAEEERKRSWQTQGLAEIGTMLRSQNNKTTQDLFDNIIRFVVKYTEANQGGLFLMEENEHEGSYIKLSSCYAYERKKFLEKKIGLGEGLVGQCILEKDTLNFTEIPKDYTHITSGLGFSTPRNLLIVPLKINDDVQGALELASFKIFEPYQISFIEKLGENIASAISSVKVNERTNLLLNQFKEQTAQMQAQEEEMRQNMEELVATQEAQSRLQMELEENGHAS